ncbi:hypothetical protein TYRP_002973 [Tyrophagus putrescentiae]|nr:hypothetical protein TYRP_002973 [Tyrophagus putrescentiae]
MNTGWHFPLGLGQLPASLRLEMMQLEMHARFGVTDLLHAYGRRPLTEEQQRRSGELVSCLVAHKNAQVEAFIVYQGRGVMPVRYEADLGHQGGGGAPFFVVNRAAVMIGFEGGDDDHHAEDDQVVPDLDAPEQQQPDGHCPLLIDARKKVLALVGQLIQSLRRANENDDEADEADEAEEEGIIYEQRVKAMLAAATLFLRALQGMSLAVNRYIEAGIVDSRTVQ